MNRDELQKELRYDSASGLLWWITPAKGRQRLRPAGTVSKDGYVRLCINYKRYLAHRVIWLIATGKWPKEEIDHINMNRSDNRLVNLREATYSQNKANAVVRRNNKARLRGVRWRADANKWEARICFNYNKMYLGLFATKELACNAYEMAAKKHFGEFARDR